MRIRASNSPVSDVFHALDVNENTCIKGQSLERGQLAAL